MTALISEKKIGYEKNNENVKTRSVKNEKTKQNILAINQSIKKLIWIMQLFQKFISHWKAVLLSLFRIKKKN